MPKVIQLEMEEMEFEPYSNLEALFQLLFSRVNTLCAHDQKKLLHIYTHIFSICIYNLLCAKYVASHYRGRSVCLLKHKGLELGTNLILRGSQSREEVTMVEDVTPK